MNESGVSKNELKVHLCVEVWWVCACSSARLSIFSVSISVCVGLVCRDYYRRSWLITFSDLPTGNGCACVCVCDLNGWIYGECSEGCFLS